MMALQRGPEVSVSMSTWWIPALRKLLGISLAFGSVIVLWVLLAEFVRPWVPAPAITWKTMLGLLQSDAFYTNLGLTLGRLVSAFFASLIIGSILGAAVGLNRRVEAFFQPLLALALAVPDAVIVIFTILAMGTGEMSGFVALTIVLTPFVANIVRSSVQARDAELDQMSHIYGFSLLQRVRMVLLPQLVPALLTAAKLSFALSWKVVILVEALSQPVGIGAAIMNAFNMLRMREVLALAILFTLLMQCIQILTIGPLEKRLLRWKK